jgi:hypothetical protein
MTIYHFCAIAQDEEGDLEYFDGVSESDTIIDSYDEYLAFKKAVKERLAPDATNVTILSLSMIG